jgi:hypothetical protein
MNWNLLESKIIDETPESSHHRFVIVGIVLILILIDQIKIFCRHTHSTEQAP